MQERWREHPPFPRDFTHEHYLAVESMIIFTYHEGTGDTKDARKDAAMYGAAYLAWQAVEQIFPPETIRTPAEALLFKRRTALANLWNEAFIKAREGDWTVVKQALEQEVANAYNPHVTNMLKTYYAQILEEIQPQMSKRLVAFTNLAASVLPPSANL